MTHIFDVVKLGLSSTFNRSFATVYTFLCATPNLLDFSAQCKQRERYLIELSSLALPLVAVRFLVVPIWVE